MIAEVAIICLAIVACYAMRLRLEYVRDEWVKRLNEAHAATRNALDEAAKAAQRVDDIKAAVGTIREHVTALQGAQNQMLLRGRV